MFIIFTSLCNRTFYRHNNSRCSTSCLPSSSHHHNFPCKPVQSSPLPSRPGPELSASCSYEITLTGSPTTLSFASWRHSLADAQLISIAYYKYFNYTNLTFYEHEFVRHILTRLRSSLSGLILIRAERFDSPEEEHWAQLSSGQALGNVLFCEAASCGGGDGCINFYIPNLT